MISGTKVAPFPLFCGDWFFAACAVFLFFRFYPGFLLLCSLIDSCLKLVQSTTQIPRRGQLRPKMGMF